MKVLVVDDEKMLADTVVELLSREKIDAEAVYDGISAVDFAMTGQYDVIILDVMLPGMNGFEVLKTLRAQKYQSPIIMLSAKTEVSDKVEGLGLGADDYLAKPFVAQELIARVKALTRRKGEFTGDTLVYCGLTLDKATYELKTNFDSVALSKKEFNIMEMLLANPKIVLNKERIAEKIWGYESDADYNNVEVYISFLRKKMKTIRSAVNIRTVRGIGYRLEVEHA